MRFSQHPNSQVACSPIVPMLIGAGSPQSAISLLDSVTAPSRSQQRGYRSLLVEGSPGVPAGFERLRVKHFLPDRFRLSNSAEHSA